MCWLCQLCSSFLSNVIFHTCEMRGAGARRLRQLREFLRKLQSVQNVCVLPYVHAQAQMITRPQSVEAGCLCVRLTAGSIQWCKQINCVFAVGSISTCNSIRLTWRRVYFTLDVWCEVRWVNSEPFLLQVGFVRFVIYERIMSQVLMRGWCM